MNQKISYVLEFQSLNLRAFLSLKCCCDFPLAANLYLSKQLCSDKGDPERLQLEPDLYLVSFRVVNMMHNIWTAVILKRMHIQKIYGSMQYVNHSYGMYVIVAATSGNKLQPQ